MSARIKFGLGIAMLMSLTTAEAYVGPGLGAGTIGVVLGVLGSIFLALFSIVYYPIKRVMKKRKGTERSKDETESAAQQGDGDARTEGSA